jgi:hypothetical protein
VSSRGHRDVRAIDLRFIDRMKFPSSVMSKCPAIRFAVNRTHRVIGRMIVLVSSITTMNIISMGGVPWGSRWASICFVLVIHPMMVTVVHRLRERGRVIDRCEVREKVWGNRAEKFMIMIDRMIVRFVFSIPLFPFVSLVLTSFFRIFNGFVSEVFSGVEDFQIIDGMRREDRIKRIHGNDHVVDDGSNVEKRLVIILLVFFLL